jgi:hypothetical protein
MGIERSAGTGKVGDWKGFLEPDMPDGLHASGWGGEFAKGVLAVGMLEAPFRREYAAWQHFTGALAVPS